MQVIFKATKKMPIYHGTITLKDGEAKEMTDAEAARVVKDFPANFKMVGAKQVHGARDKAIG